LPEAIVPKVGHGPKMGQYGFDRACFSVVYLFLLCFIAHLYDANGGTDMEVLACFRPGFLRWAYVQPCHSKGLGESFPLVWLNIGLS